ncbi:MAG: DUF6128 domain-containing protein [Eubacteriales bacterium]|nr:DUF6128 domain-containing protein [Eubacteriales bacterium]
MTGYQKSIAYLDYLENGMKTGNAGFVRLEANNGQMRLEMKVKNIPEKFSGEYELKADAGGTIGRIELNEGTGSCCIVQKTGMGDWKGKKTVQAKGLYIRLPGRRLLQAAWPLPMEFFTEEEGELSQTEEADVEETAAPEPVSALTASDVVPENSLLDTVPATVAEEVLPDAVPTAVAERALLAAEPAAPASETDQERENTADTKTAGGSLNGQEEGAAQAERREEEPVCYGDKWEQLSHMYAQIHPFGDEREYLSIAPKDFVVLRQEYQKMVHNSFLLHGYYNYKHLILGKIKEKDGWSYYLGVPGNFYKREKMVAEMFGFEAFEGEKNPAKAGDFGYFMKRVEI